MIAVAWLVSWLTAVCCATIFLPRGAGLRVSAIVSVGFGAIALAPAVAAQTRPGRSLAESVCLAAVLIALVFVPCGIGLSCAIRFGRDVARQPRGAPRRNAKGGEKNEPGKPDIGDIEPKPKDGK
jgi:hypothetical protein